MDEMAFPGTTVRYLRPTYIDRHTVPTPFCSSRFRFFLCSICSAAGCVAGGAQGMACRYPCAAHRSRDALPTADANLPPAHSVLGTAAAAGNPWTDARETWTGCCSPSHGVRIA